MCNSYNKEQNVKSSSKWTFLEVYSSFVAASTFLCIGLLRAYTSPAISSMREDPHLFYSTSFSEKDIISWFASSPSLAAFIGTVIAGPMLQHLGRQGTLFFLSIPYICGWIGIAFAGTDVSLIISGRLLTGLAGGLSTASAQLYISECVRAEIRGTLGFIPAMMLALGVLLGFAMGFLNLHWNDFALVHTAFPVVLLLMTLTLPESPPWLLLRDKETKAIRNLKRLRGEKNVELVEMEIADLKRTLKTNSSSSSGNQSTDSVSILKMLRRRSVAYPAFIAVFLMIFQQFSGVNVVISYLSIILTEAEPQSFKMGLGNGTVHSSAYGMSHNVSSVIVGVVQFLAFFVSLPLVDRLGRRILLICSGLAMCVPLATFAFYSYCNQPDFFLQSDTCESFVESTGYWLPTTCLSIFIAAYSIGFGPVCFIMMGELFPTRARSYLVSLTSFVNHLCIFIVMKTFPVAVDLVGSHGTFGTYSGCCLLSILFVLWIVPETKGKTLAEIETSFVKQQMESPA